MSMPSASTSTVERQVSDRITISSLYCTQCGGVVGSITRGFAHSFSESELELSLPNRSYNERIASSERPYSTTC